MLIHLTVVEVLSVLNGLMFSRLDSQVLKQLNFPPEMQLSLSDERGDIEKSKRPWHILPAGHKIGVPAPLFKELVMHCSLPLYFIFYHSSIC